MACEGVDKEISRRQAISLLAVAGAGVMLGLRRRDKNRYHHHNHHNYSKYFMYGDSRR
jgi:hypothetical protein